MSDVTNWSRRCKAYTLKRSLRANLVKRCHACDLLLDTAVCEDCRPNGGACVITAPDIYSKSPSPPHLTLLNLAIALALPFPRMSSLGLLMHRSTRCVLDKASAAAEVRDDSVMGGQSPLVAIRDCSAPPPRQRMHVNGDFGDLASVPCSDACKRFGRKVSSL